MHKKEKAWEILGHSMLNTNLAKVLKILRLEKILEKTNRGTK